MHGHRPHRTVFRGRLLAAALALALAAGGVARGDGWTLQLNPGYTGSRTTSTDETGHESTTENTAVTQRYRLSLEDTIYPTLTLLAGGTLDWTQLWTTQDGLTRQNDVKQWNGFGRLRMGGPILSAALDYDHREQDTKSSGTGLPSFEGALLRDVYGGSISWRPADLPSLDLRLTRTDSHDRDRLATDTTVQDALLSTRFMPDRNTDLRYSLRGMRNDDHVNDVRADEVTHSASATWSGGYLGGRGTAYVNYVMSAVTTSVTARGTGGIVSTAQLPVAGLSIVEVFPDEPARVSLQPNSALIDGVTGASAGINIGSAGSTPTGERPYRDLGAQFANATLPVNVIHVYVDRLVPVDVAAQFTWTLYQGDDNLTWTQVGSPVIASFDPLTNRFEIQVERTAARYLKLVTRPLPATVATAQYPEILVTELQFFEVVSAQEAAGRQSMLAGSLNATTKIRLLDSRTLTLSYDLTSNLTHSSTGEAVIYSFINGISAKRPLGRTLTLAARGERTDGDAGRGHEALNRWNASLAYDPFRTLGAAVVYSGQYYQPVGGTATSHTVAGSVRADLYQGIATNASVTYGQARDQTGRQSTTVAATGSATLTPNAVLSMAGSVGYTDSHATGGGRPDRTDQRGILEGSASLTPFPALAMSGTLTRIFGATLPGQTLASFAGTFAPFPGGDLQLRYMYQETLDTSYEQRTRTHGPSLRWNVRRGAFLEVGYTYFASRAPAADETSEYLFANLSITLR